MITDETKVMTEDIIKDVKKSHFYYLKPWRNYLRLMAKHPAIAQELGPTIVSVYR